MRCDGGKEYWKIKDELNYYCQGSPSYSKIKYF